GCALAIMMMFGGRFLCCRVMTRVNSGVIMHRAAVVHVAHGDLMMHRSEIRRLCLNKTRRRTIAPRKRGSRREDAEQIGEGDKPPHPKPYRPRQQQKHPSPGAFRSAFMRSNVAHADCKLMAKHSSAKPFLPRRTAHA